MNVSLTPELDTYVQEKVKTGMYHSASEVIREGLRLLRERDALQEIRLRELKQQVQAGFAQIERGEYIDFASPDEIVSHIARLKGDQTAK
jgi:antitoxin ParD1/3/4